MKTKLTLFVTIAALTFTPCLGAETPNYPPINPALTYWQAAALLPDLKGEKADMLRDFATGKRPFDAGKAKELLSQSEQSLRTFKKAAASPAPCDWGLALEEGPALALPHVSKMMELSRLAILKADSLFAEGKATEGVDWLLAAHRAARHAGAGDLLISALVQTSIEATTINAAARHCLGWDEATRKSYSDGTKTLPPFHTLQDAFGGEYHFVDWIERRFDFNGPKKSKEVDDMMAAASSSKDAAEKEGMLKLFHEQFTPQNSAKRFADMRDLYRRTQAALGKPWKESQAELKDLQKEALQSNVVVRLAYPAFQELNAKRFEIATLHTMLDAALQYGPKLDEAAAATFKDSFDGEPVMLKKAEDGSLTLTTAKQYRKGKDIQLKLDKQ